ncbi:MAG: hypothetical protein IT535_10405 [Bauldia sp.]|nr:hypothetical protein [Bauldia sp.]
MFAILGGILAIVLGAGMFWVLRRSPPGSLLMRFDDFAVVLMLGLLVLGVFSIGSGLTSGPGPAEASP